MQPPVIAALDANKDGKLDAAEIEVPTTWTGIYDAAMAVQDRDNELWGMAIMTKRDPQTGINLWTFINAWGNDLFDENYEAAFANDKGYAAAESVALRRAPRPDSPVVARMPGSTPGSVLRPGLLELLEVDQAVLENL